MSLLQPGQLQGILLAIFNVYVTFWALNQLVVAYDSIKLLSSDSSQQSPAKICILIPTTSRKQDWKTVDDTFLLQYPLPSLAKTCEPQRYSYSVFVGYDVGDPFFDNEETLSALTQEAKEAVPFAKFSIIPFVNSLSKPGPVANFLSREAYNDGCDFLYQIGDDTELLTPRWTSKFVDALRSFTPPLHGVVGPRCAQGNKAIITHDFVHRSHQDMRCCSQADNSCRPNKRYIASQREPMHCWRSGRSRCCRCS